MPGGLGAKLATLSNATLQRKRSVGFHAQQPSQLLTLPSTQWSCLHRLILRTHTHTHTRQTLRTLHSAHPQPLPMRRLEVCRSLLAAAEAFGIAECWHWKPVLDGKQVRHAVQAEYTLYF